MTNFLDFRFNHGGTHLIGTIHEKLKDAVNFEEGSVVSVSKGNHDEITLTPNSQVKDLSEKDWQASQVKIVHEKLVLKCGPDSKPVLVNQAMWNSKNGLNATKILPENVGSGASFQNFSIL